ncbi:MAG TPA: glycosyltransferase [Pseudonocardiaceae bacterium]|nr:glycosyltransferase [Pseudonocardiaceae bacterium]
MTRPRKRGRLLRAPLVLAGVMAGLVVVLLVVAGYTGAQVGIDAHAHEPVAADQVPGAVLNGGSVVDATGHRVVSHALPPKTVVLTFDDGPDPMWTPKVLDVLRKYDVPATFFVVGSMAVRHPELVRAIHESGGELGVHTFTHPDLIDVSPWRLEKELAVTQFALAGGANVASYLIRPPYSAGAGDVDNLGYRTVLEAGDRGYLSVFTDVDSEDWQRPGVDAIVRNATPHDGRGATVLMHDAGGDRSQTVAALDRLIPKLQAEGYRFTTVADAVGLPEVNPPASLNDRVLGLLLLGTTGLSLGFVAALRWIMVGVGALVAIRFLVLVVVARRHVRRRRSPARWGPEVTEPVSVIVPAYNESANIEATLRSILAGTHPVEVIVVDDGSTDGTADIVEGLGLPVRLVRQPNSGKSTALNTGIALAGHDIIVMMDGDTVFEPETVHRMVQPFADPTVGAVAGNVKIANRHTLLGRLQHIEYVIGFNLDRRMQDVLGCMPTVPGAGGAFRRSALVEVGGLSDDTIAEDTDLTIAVGRAGWRVLYEDSATSWTEAPATVRQLALQRYRWTYGTLQAVWKHRAAIVQRGTSGRIGRWGLLHMLVFQMLLPLSAPVVDLFLAYGLLFLDTEETLLLWAAVLAIQLAGAALALRWDGEHRSQIWILPLQQVLYRQLMYVVLVQSVVTAVSGTRVRWHKLRRTGGLDLVLRDMTPAPVTPVAGVVRLTQVAKPTRRAKADRERWPDLLRAVAMVRVVCYHVFGGGWLSMVFPSMGVMFALGGSLMAKSMDRSAAIDVIGNRLRRLLPPLWLFGAIMIPLMLWHGWSVRLSQLLLWVFPIADPPGSEWGTDATAVLWYVRAYVWFVLLTPLLLRWFRRHPVLTTVAPLVLVAGNELLGAPLADWGMFGPAVLDLAIFGACWVLGFAHRDGTLARMRPVTVATLASAAIGVGALWTVTHPSPDAGFDLNEIALGQALISVGAVLVLLRLSPKLTWLSGVPVLDQLIKLINARAITIYLWHNVAIDLAVPVEDWLGWSSQFSQLGITVLLTGIAVMAFGWVEDVAAHRRVQLLPITVGRGKPAFAT